MPHVQTQCMSLLSPLGQGDPHAASQLLPLVCEGLRKLAALRLAQERADEAASHKGPL
jgi:hypothetical protein